MTRLKNAGIAERLSLHRRTLDARLHRIDATFDVTSGTATTRVGVTRGLA
ncbi:MAG: hypothetical protein WKF80_02995 [Thermomicrobiales bacterium]